MLVLAGEQFHICAQSKVRECYYCQILHLCILTNYFYYPAASLSILHSHGKSKNSPRNFTPEIVIEAYLTSFPCVNLNRKDMFVCKEVKSLMGSDFDAYRSIGQLTASNKDLLRTVCNKWEIGCHNSFFQVGGEAINILSANVKRERSGKYSWPR